ncbi:MAG: iron chelate uptake ABC transporter family permease subunit [Pseudonocardiaceae bacterium]|nr:iron chelate uptake ABC transporter family permease subunit [Pseudonocardiaceae bacterium]
MTGVQSDAAATSTSSGLARTNAVRGAWVALFLALLVMSAVVSIAVGNKFIPPDEIWRVLWYPDQSLASDIVRDLRIPRTLLGILAGALIMALTRNPLADPGILGVNAGAQFFVVLAVALLGLTTFGQYVWFSFAGAIGTTVMVYSIGSIGRGGGTPVRLTLAGVALGAVLSGVASGITLLNPRAFDRLRTWSAGSLAGRELDVVLQLLPFVVVGALIAFALPRRLNAVALGDDLASAFGVSMRTTRLWGIVAVTILCGATTTVAGPISFVGLVVPHIVRWFFGPDQRWIFSATVVAAPTLVLIADITGRLVIRPGEIQVGLMTAFIGAPVLIALVRRKRVSGL